MNYYHGNLDGRNNIILLKVYFIITRTNFWKNSILDQKTKVI